MPRTRSLLKTEGTTVSEVNCPITETSHLTNPSSRPFLLGPNIAPSRPRDPECRFLIRCLALVSLAINDQGPEWVRVLCDCCFPIAAAAAPAW